MCGWRSRLSEFKGSGVPIQCDRTGSVGTVLQEPYSDSKPALFSADNSM
jgi:hypothetical protein